LRPIVKSRLAVGHGRRSVGTVHSKLRRPRETP
jgi:hypothetical protein